MKVTHAGYEALMSPLVAVPTTEELFDFQVKNFVDKGVVKSGKVLEKLKKHLPKKGMIIVVPSINLSFNDLMSKVVLDGKSGYNCLNLDYHENLIRTSKKSYLCIDVEDGRKMTGQSVIQYREEFKKQKRSGLVTLEGVLLLISFPEILKHHYIDLTGSRFGSDWVPNLYLNVDRPELHWCYLVHADDRWGAASCGSRVGL